MLIWGSSGLRGNTKIMRSITAAVVGAMCCLSLGRVSAREGVVGVAVEDLKTPERCYAVEEGDHVLMKYSVKQTHSGEDVYSCPGDESFHFVVGDDKVAEGLNRGVIGACEGAVRRITVPPSLGFMNRTRGPPMEGIGALDDTSITLDFYVTVENVTKPEDFAIFRAISERNISHVMTMVEKKKGINAVDEWGATPLMVAISGNLEVVVATLLNAWRPRVNVNARKPSGYNALTYAAASGNPSVVRALLKRGADPNTAVLSGASAGWTPLHFAIKLEQLRNAAALVEYGANPLAAAADGTRPIDLVPGLEPRNRGAFTKLLVDAAERWRTSLPAPPSSSQATPSAGQSKAASRPVDPTLDNAPRAPRATAASAAASREL